MSFPFTGIDALLANPQDLKKLSQMRVGLLTNQNILTQAYVPTAQALQQKIGKALKAFLTPEHGWSGQLMEGISSQDDFDTMLRLPTWSLYNAKGIENTALNILEQKIDTILIDLQDVGLRCYTYAATCAQLMEALKGTNVQFMVCDRPNPLGPIQRGPSLDPAYRSILGYLDVPWQHGKTLGQLLTDFNDTLGEKSLPLTVISCQLFYEPYEYSWTLPSPNLPSWEAMLLYPALVMLEGTNISEGRGTTLPFTILGAPSLNSHALVDFLNGLENSGIRARPITFIPQRSKWQNETCHGAHIAIMDPRLLNAYELGLELLQFLYTHYPPFSWTPWEGKSGGYMIDFLMGMDGIRRTREAK